MRVSEISRIETERKRNEDNRMRYHIFETSQFEIESSRARENCTIIAAVVDNVSDLKHASFYKLVWCLCAIFSSSVTLVFSILISKRIILPRCLTRVNSQGIPPTRINDHTTDFYVSYRAQQKKITQHRDLVEQLRREASITRMPASEAIQDLITYVQDRENEDPLRNRRILMAENPFEDSNMCPCNTS